MTIFTDYFGDTPRASLLDFLGDHPTSDYNITELAAKSGITRQTAYSTLEGLLEVNMVKHTRDVGQSRMFALNIDHDVIQSVLRADMAAQREKTRKVLLH